MSWLRRRLELPAPLLAFLEDRLVAAGHVRLAAERRPGEPVVRLEIFAENAADLPRPEDLAAWLAEAEDLGLPAAALRWEDAPVPERDWSEGFRRRFARRRLLPEVEVLPPWDPAAPALRRRRPAPGAGAALALVIEPAQVFGGGEHPTTRGCLRRLAAWTRRRGGPFDCLDVGSGTGILSLAARRWGGARVEGWDLDAASIVNAYLNADLNGLAGELRFRWGEPRDLAPAAWDLVLANLFLGPILRLLPRLDAALRPGGTTIFSGLLATQAGRVAEAAGARGWRPVGQDEDEGWVIQEWRRP
ncbi:MAG: 50S ribosomal protein L11 methyltransferase [Candidatus Krumholzibacteriota bacterium]|nr:50S ribosomal protein L11 methyltransferase [Candidatus Krumholzibacteriota bacterium]